jgi:magnesium transporter
VLNAIKLPLASQAYSENVNDGQQRRARFSLEGSFIKESLPKASAENFDQSQNLLQSAPHGDHHNKERLGTHLHPRDMRRLATPFSLSNEPELIVRRHVMLLNFDPLRAIILRDRLLVLVPDGADSLLETIEKRVRAGAAGFESDIFGEPLERDPATSASENEHFLQTTKAHSSDIPPPSETATLVDDDEFGSEQLERDEFEELRRKTWINLPFELQCMDAVLHGATELLASQALDIQIDALSSMEYLLKPGTGVGTFAQDMLRTTKTNVHRMLSRVNAFVRAMTQILNEDEDMALCNLSRLITHPERFVQPVSAQVLEEESDEPELIFVSTASSDIAAPAPSCV